MLKISDQPDNDNQQQNCGAIGNSNGDQNVLLTVSICAKEHKNVYKIKKHKLFSISQTSIYEILVFLEDYREIGSYAYDCL